jgi:hypothetical protein
MSNSKISTDKVTQQSPLKLAGSAHLMNIIAKATQASKPTETVVKLAGNTLRDELYGDNFCKEASASTQCNPNWSIGLAGNRN